MKENFRKDQRFERHEFQKSKLNSIIYFLYQMLSINSKICKVIGNIPTLLVLGSFLHFCDLKGIYIQFDDFINNEFFYYYTWPLTYYIFIRQIKYFQ